MKQSHAVAVLIVLSSVLCSLSCGSSSSSSAQKTLPDCPTGTRQCGYGCLVNSCLCCNSKEYSSDWDLGTFECPGAGIAACVPNTAGTCTAAVSGTGTAMTPSGFCCSTNSNVGSKDCKNGTVACNQNCIPVGALCCSAIDPTDCRPVGGVPVAASGTDGGSKTGSGGVSGTWTGNYTMTTDFSYFCDNVATVTYSGTLTMTLSQDAIGMVSGTVSMTNMTVASVNQSNGQCGTAKLSPSDPIVTDGGMAYGTSVNVNVDMGPSFGSYWGTNQLLYFTGTLNASTITGTIRGSTDGGTGGTSGTFSVTKH